MSHENENNSQNKFAKNQGIKRREGKRVEREGNGR